MWMDVVLCLAAFPVSVASGYLLTLTALSKRRPSPAYPPAPQLRFAVVVPAHNEEGGIAATVQNLRAVDYPNHLFSVVVVADNCTDQTAASAEKAGARVFVRQDENLRGKGYALSYAFGRLASEVDALVVVDADTVVSSNMLRAFARRIEAGASVVQADYAVRNASAAWRTRLMAIAFGAFHIVRSLARERLRVSSGLRGNGMCFTSRVLAAVPYDAFSVVEDVEYGIRLGEAGHRVEYAWEAHVYGEMVSSERASRSQRHRWEGGRAALARIHTLPLLRHAMARRDRVLFDLAADILVPPLGTLVTVIALGLFAALGVGYVEGRSVALWIWLANLTAVLVYVLRGWSLSGTGGRGLLDLGFAPFYVGWKMWLRLRRPRASGEWVRTTREAPPEAPAVIGTPPTG